MSKMCYKDSKEIPLVKVSSWKIWKMSTYKLNQVKKDPK